MTSCAILRKSRTKASTRSKKCGSAILFILIMVLAISFVVVTAAFFGNTTLDNEFRYEDAIKAQRTWDAAVSQLDAQEAAGNLAVPYRGTFSLNGFSGTIVAIDNSSNLANSIAVSSTLTAADGRTYPESSIIAKASLATPFYYAMFVNSAFALSNHKYSSGALGSNGDIYSNGNMSISTNGSGNTINGNVLSTGSISLSGPSVTGSQYQNSSPVTFTTPSAASYSMVASATTSSTSLAGYTFGSVPAGSPYPVLYESAGNVTVSGTFSGVGTVYFAGNVTLSSSISYANSNSHVAFIVGGSLTANASSMVGYWYVAGGTTAGATTVTNTGGAIISSTFSSNSNLSLTLDPTVKNSATTGNLMYLPGYTWSANDLLTGTYSGTYTVQGNSDSGTIAFTVSKSGVVSGTINDKTLGAGTVSGTLASTGAFNATYVLGSGSFTSSGTLTLSGTTLSGTLTASSSFYGTYTHIVTMTN